MINAFSALHIRVENEEKGKHTTGPHPFECWEGACGAGGWVHLSHKAPMRLIAERYPGQMTIPLSKCSPSGELRRG